MGLTRVTILRKSWSEDRAERRGWDDVDGAGKFDLQDTLHQP
jgi:hypothetical protein